MWEYLSKKQKELLRISGITLVIVLVFKYLIPLIFPFMVAFLLSLLIRPTVRFLYRMFRIPMGAGAGIVLAGLLAVIGVVGFWLGRLAVGQLIQLGQQLPDLWDEFSWWLWDCCGQMEDALKLQEGTISLTIRHWIHDIAQGGDLEEDAVGAGQIWKMIETSLKGATGFLRSMVSMLVTFFVTIGATLITTAQLESLRQVMERSPYGKEIRYVGSVLKRVGVAYGKTQLVIILCTIVISGVGLTVLGDPYALLWALVIGLVDALPIFGAGTVLWPWIALSLFQKQWVRAAGLAVIYVISNLTRQWLEARYMGDRIGISPLENLIAMYVGLKLFGVVGLFLGSIGYLLIKETAKRQGQSEKTGDKY